MVLKWITANAPINWVPQSNNVYETDSDGAITIPDELGADIDEAQTSGLFSWEAGSPGVGEAEPV